MKIKITIIFTLISFGLFSQMTYKDLSDTVQINLIKNNKIKSKTIFFTKNKPLRKIQYNEHGQVIHEEYYHSTPPCSIKYLYNNLGKIEEIKKTNCTSNSNTKFNYDKLGNISSITDIENNNIIMKDSFVYDLKNLTKKLIYRNNDLKWVRYYKFNNDNQIIEQEDENYITNYIYDNKKLIKENKFLISSKILSQTIHFEYNENDLITKETCSGLGVSWSRKLLYDKFGKLIYELSDNKKVYYSYNKEGQLIKEKIIMKKKLSKKDPKKIIRLFTYEYYN